MYQFAVRVYTYPETLLGNLGFFFIVDTSTVLIPNIVIKLFTIVKIKNVPLKKYE